MATSTTPDVRPPIGEARPFDNDITPGHRPVIPRRLWGWLLALFFGGAVGLGGCVDATPVEPTTIGQGGIALLVEAAARRQVEITVECDDGFEARVVVDTHDRGQAGEIGDAIIDAPLGMCRVSGRVLDDDLECESAPVHVEVVEGLTAVRLTFVCRGANGGGVNVTAEVFELNRLGLPGFSPGKWLRQCGLTEMAIEVVRRNGDPYILDVQPDPGAEAHVRVTDMGDDTFRITCLDAPPAPYEVPLTVTMAQYGVIAAQVPAHVFCYPGDDQAACEQACSPAEGTPTATRPFATAPDVPPACALDGEGVVMASAGAPTAGPAGCMVDIQPLDLSSMLLDGRGTLTAVLCSAAAEGTDPMPVTMYMGQDPELMRATLSVAPGCAPYPLTGVDFAPDADAIGDMDWTAIEQVFLVHHPGDVMGPSTVQLVALRYRCCDGPVDGCGECDGEPPVEVCDGEDNTCDLEVDEGFPIGDACAVGVGACRAEGELICDPAGPGVVCDAEPGQPGQEICGNDVDEDCSGEIDDGCVCDAIDEWQVVQPANCNHFDGTDDARDDCMDHPGPCGEAQLEAFCRRRDGSEGEHNPWLRWGLERARERWPACRDWELLRMDVPGYGNRKVWRCASVPQPVCNEWIWITPLAIRFGETPIAYTEGPGPHRFDIAGTGHSDPRVWPELHWLVRLPKPGEALTPAHLFGDPTPAPNGVRWQDGYDALLSTVPEAADGLLTADEAAAAGVGLWLDDGDRRATPDELTTFSQHGITAIETTPHRRDRWSFAPGGQISGEAAVHTDGRQRASVVDVYLAVSPGDG